MHILMALLSGLIFGIGLVISGMTDPSKVIGFLDLAGNWNPSLGFVLAGAILVGLVGFHFASRRATTLLGAALRLPTGNHIDRRLVLGSLAFGAGWGLAGYCPGPALASLAADGDKPLVFVAAMVAGMALFALFERLAVRRRAQ